MPTKPSCLVLCKLIANVHVKFQCDPICSFWDKVVRMGGNLHNYANLCKTMRAPYLNLLSSLQLNMKKIHIKFHINPTSTFREKVVRTDGNCKKRHKSYIIMLLYAKLCMPMTPSCLVLCTLI